MPSTHTSVTSFSSATIHGQQLYRRLQRKFSQPGEASEVFFTEKDVSGIVMLGLSLVLVGIIIIFSGIFFFASSQISKVRDYLSTSMLVMNNVQSIDYESMNSTTSLDDINLRIGMIEQNSNGLYANVNHDTEKLTNLMKEYCTKSKAFFSYLKSSPDTNSQEYKDKVNELNNIMNQIKAERKNLVENYNLKNIPDIQ